MERSKVTDNPTFEVEEIFFTHIQADQEQAHADASLAVSVECGPLSSELRDGGTDIEIKTGFQVAITDRSHDNALVATLETHVIVALEASRAVTLVEAEEGLLAPAQELAMSLSLPYHRMKIEALTVALGLPPFTLPPSMKLVSASTGEADVATKL
jgi:hypothetical protein